MSNSFLPRLPGSPVLPEGVLAIATVGNVSDMLIHNVRNLLSVISMQAQLIQGKGEVSPDANRRLNEIVSQVEAIDGQLGAMLRLSGLQPRHRTGWSGFLMEIEEITGQIYTSLEITYTWPEQGPAHFHSTERALLHHLILQVLHFLVHHDPGKHPIRVSAEFPEPADIQADTRLLRLEWLLECPLPPGLFEPGRGLAGNGREKPALALGLPEHLARALDGELHRELRTDDVRLETTVRLAGWERQHTDDQRDPVGCPA